MSREYQTPIHSDPDTRAREMYADITTRFFFNILIPVRAMSINLVLY